MKYSSLFVVTQQSIKKNLLFFFVSTLLSSILLLGCIGTSGDKSLAIEKTKVNLKQQLRQEIDPKIDKKENFKINYVNIIIARSTIEVLEIKQIGGKKAAVVKVSKIPLKVRQPLIEIIGKIEEWKDSKFNTSDAINMIYQQLGLPLSEMETTTYEVFLD